MWFQITNSQRMALCDILLDRTRSAKATQRYVDVVAEGVVTTPAELLETFMMCGVQDPDQWKDLAEIKHAVEAGQTVGVGPDTEDEPENEPSMTDPEQDEVEEAVLEEGLVQDAVDLEATGQGDDPAVD